MDGYFHQDYDVGGEDDAAILTGFASSAGTDAVAAVIGEIDDQLAEPVAGLLDRFRQRTGEWNMLIGDDDAAAREWLLAARRVLARAPTRPTPLAARSPPPQPVIDRLRAAVRGAPAAATTTPYLALADLAQRFLARRDVYPTDAAALADFCRTAWPEQIARAADETKAFLAQPERGARARWLAIAPGLSVADDAAARSQVERVRVGLLIAPPNGG